MPLDNASTREVPGDRRFLPPVPDAELVAHSPSMRALVEILVRVAASSAPVVIVGEVGVGKTRVARAIHARSARGAGPFVCLSATSAPEPLLESELVGHVRGAFGAATEDRPGLVARADGGTLLLDELGEIPRAVQSRLVAVLRDGQVRPVGADAVRDVDVRFIATTRDDLDALVREGRLHPDLRYRLNVVTLVVPPLRERREDLPALARRFLEEARLRAPASPVVDIDDEAMAALVQAPWPGNVRELGSTIERLVVLGAGPTVRVEDLAFLEAAGDHPWPIAQSGLCTLREMNQRYLDWVLSQTGGNKERAAKILGIDLSTLYRWRRSGKYRTA